MNKLDYFANYTGDKKDTIGELAAGFDTYTRPSSAKLVGKTFTLFCDDGRELQYHFVDNSQVELSGNPDSSESYVAFEEAPNVFLVSHGVSGMELPTNRFLILDLELERALVVTATITDTSGDRGRTEAEFAQAGIDRQLEVPMAYAADLVGKRTIWAYSDNHLFEHIYLNQNTFIWHCIKGAEVNQAYAEKAAYFEIRPNVYVLYWRQGKWAMETVGILNFEAWTVTLSSFAWDAAEQAISSGTENGYGRLLNDTVYDGEDVLAAGYRAFQADERQTAS